MDVRFEFVPRAAGMQIGELSNNCGSASRRATGDQPSAQQALLAVLAQGGHVVANGGSGSIVLGRGCEALLMLEAGFVLASGRSDQS